MKPAVIHPALSAAAGMCSCPSCSAQQRIKVPLVQTHHLKWNADRELFMGICAWGICAYSAAHWRTHTPQSECKIIQLASCKASFLSWRNNSLETTWQLLESSLCHLTIGGRDCGVQVFQLDRLSCSVHSYFLPEIITKSHQLSVMTTRRNFSSPSLVTQLLFFAWSVPVYLSCYLPSLVQNKCGRGRERVHCLDHTVWELQFKTEHRWTTLLGVFISEKRRQTGLEKTTKKRPEKLKLSPALHYPVF